MLCAHVLVDDLEHVIQVGAYVVCCVTMSWWMIESTLARYTGWGICCMLCAHVLADGREHTMQVGAYVVCCVPISWWMIESTLCSLGHMSYVVCPCLGG